MKFKDIILKLLEGKLDTNNNPDITINTEVWNEVYCIMLELARLYGSNSTKDILEKLAR